MSVAKSAQVRRRIWRADLSQRFSLRLNADVPQHLPPPLGAQHQHAEPEDGEEEREVRFGRRHARGQPDVVRVEIDEQALACEEQQHGASHFPLVAEARATGVDVLSKPIAVEELRAVLDRAGGDG
jgi:hypothetical protein